MCCMSVDSNTLHSVYAWAMRDLKVLESRVRQGSGVEFAAEFAAFVMNSGICALMNDNPELNITLRKAFPYNGVELFRVANDLRLECGQYYQGRTSKAEGTAKGVKQSELEAINHKLDLLAGQLASLQSVKPARKRLRKPCLKVIGNTVLHGNGAA